MYLGQTGRGQTLDSTPGNAATDPKITAKVTLKPEMAVPPHRDKNYPVPQFPCLGGLLSFHILALAASQHRKLSPGAPQGQGTRGPLQMPTSQSSSSDLRAGICWVQEQHVLSRAGQGMVAGCPSITVLTAGTGSPMAGLVGGEQVRGCSRGLHATKDSEGHGPGWEEQPGDRVSSLQCLPSLRPAVPGGTRWPKADPGLCGDISSHPRAP